MQKQALMNVMAMAATVGTGRSSSDAVRAGSNDAVGGDVPTFGYQFREEPKRTRHGSDSRTDDQRKADRKANRKRKRAIVARRGRR